ncbi:MAG: hypothetical protein ACYTGC_17430 [Planctomycetota bacterium]
MNCPDRFDIAAAARCIVLAIAMAAGSDPAGAQTSRPEDPPTPAASGEGLLAGPRVDEQPPVTSTRRRGNDFAPGMDRPGRGDVVPGRRWLGLFRTLELTETQAEQARQILAELDRAARRYRRTHGPELRRLQRSARRLRREREQLDEKQRRRLRKLLDERPRPHEYQVRLWDLLDAAQQGEMLVGLEGERRRREQRSSDRGRAGSQRDANDASKERPRRRRTR